MKQKFDLEIESLEKKIEEIRNDKNDKRQLAQKIQRYQSEIDLTIMNRDELIKKNKLKNNLQEVNQSHDHEHFDIMHADFQQHEDEKDEQTAADLLKENLRNSLISKNSALKKIHYDK